MLDWISKCWKKSIRTINKQVDGKEQARMLSLVNSLLFGFYEMEKRPSSLASLTGSNWPDRSTANISDG